MFSKLLFPLPTGLNNDFEPYVQVCETVWGLFLSSLKGLNKVSRAHLLSYNCLNMVSVNLSTKHDLFYKIIDLQNDSMTK